jgi:hypothetical protein
MGRVVLDPQLRAKLNGLNEQLELCDEAGTILGHFLPESLYRELVVNWSKTQLSDAELERRRQEPRGRTLAEIWQHLGNT